MEARIRETTADTDRLPVFQHLFPNSRRKLINTSRQEYFREKLSSTTDCKNSVAGRERTSAFMQDRARAHN